MNSWRGHARPDVGRPRPPEKQRQQLRVLMFTRACSGAEVVVGAATTCCSPQALSSASQHYPRLVRRVVTPVLVLVGALTALAAVALLRVGAKPCRDVILVEVSAACAEPSAAAWALWTALVLGGLGGWVLARVATRRR